MLCQALTWLKLKTTSLENQMRNRNLFTQCSYIPKPGLMDYPPLIYAIFVPYINFEFICWKFPVACIYGCQRGFYLEKKMVLVLITILNSFITIVNPGFTSSLWQPHNSRFIDFVICSITVNANLLYRLNSSPALFLEGSVAHHDRNRPHPSTPFPPRRKTQDRK